MSSTVIDKPTANTPTSGRGSGAVSGAASGAAAGTMVMPGIGTVVGAVIGAAAGYLGGAEADKSQKHASLAYKYAKLRGERQAAIARRNVVAQFRMARASAMTMIGNEEGGRRSSAPQGAIASTGAQFGVNLNYFDADVYLQSMYQKHSNKAGKKAATANMINSTLTSVASSASSFGGSGFFSPQASSGPSTAGAAPAASSPRTYSAGWSGPR